ncbi:MAG: sensor histidine kinase [Cytophagales bacterium]|nr:MAG: sensor histidine kinase [Cytophagales bacterium]
MNFQALNSPQQSTRILLHVIFWASYVIFFTFLWGSYEQKYWQEFSIQLILLPVQITVVYLTIYYLLPQFLIRKRYIPFIFAFFITLIIAGLIQRALALYFIYSICCQEYMNESYFRIHKIIKSIVNISSVLFFATTIKTIKYLHKQEQATQNLEKEKLEAELKFLKGQIHPHFLFNTLNNLYALTLKKSDNAPDIVLKLSELLQYMLYDSNAPVVALEKEIHHLQSYISLEKMRYGKRLEVNFQVYDTLKGSQIAPMLILPFVENSFKHGASGDIEEPWISIDIALKDQQMTLKVENSKSLTPSKHSEKDYAKGIGLQNVQRRLELLYPQQHDLKIFDEADTFLVVLKINLQHTPIEAKIMI